ncbi:MAG: DUF3307 domain-containing protein [Bacteroidales bacterium]|nr:DUF3307 domain-containing protein [Bacteroidales bacterium]MCF8332605.1 DUF3307 domain-containing protein [Bacteroidales bacterium]
MNILMLIQLLLAHILTDFVFQSKQCVENKRYNTLKSHCFWFHIILSGVLTYILLMQWTNWLVPVIIALTHFLIDYWKIRKEQQMASSKKGISHSKYTFYFFLDQLFHLLVVIVVWLSITNGFGNMIGLIEELFTNVKYLSIFTALIIIIWPTGIIIGKMTEPFRKEITYDDSLTKAGTYIGITERILVLLFVLYNQYAVIGFLIAGKSILRVGRDNDRDTRKKTEYVLTGTLLSYSIAIVMGVIVNYVLATY